MEHLISRCKDLRKKEAQVSLELRRNGGHGGKISSTVLIWLQGVERIRTRLSDLQDSSSSDHSSTVLKLTHEVDCLLTNTSSSLVFNARDGGVDHRTVHTGNLPSQPLVGKSAEKTTNKIWNYLLDPDIGKLGFYGEGGAGKTTIMKNIKNQLTNADIFDEIIWVTLSKHPMRLRDLQDDIAVQLGIKLSAHDDSVSEAWASQISSALKKLKTCLIVFDDVWKPILLKKIGIPGHSKDNGCKVVLITRFDKVCDEMRVHKKIQVKPLSEDEACDLFVSRAGVQVLDAEINSVAKEFVHACRGLPITIITVAHAMRNEVTLHSWRQALRDLPSTATATATGSKLVTFSYRRLRNEVVQKCFLSCAFFPEDYRFEPTELVSYWIAEDFIHTEGDILASTNEGNEILKELKDANMLETFMEGHKEWLKMHDIFRDLAIRVMEKEHCFFTRAGRRAAIFPHTFHLQQLKQAKKLSLFRNEIDRLNDVSLCCNLTTLLLTYNSLSYISPSIFNGVPNLQLLDMSYSGIKRLPTSLSRLAKLRVLRLQYCTGLKKITLSLENNDKLQVLNLRGTLIKELPRGVENLVKLRSLDLSETVMLEYIQKGVISSLSNLQELQMQGSRLCQMESPVVASWFKEIRCLQQLAILTLSGVGFEDHLDTILHLQGYKLKVFLMNVYGSTLDYIDDM